MGIHGRDYMRDVPTAAAGEAGPSYTVRLLVAHALLWFLYAGALSAAGPGGGLFAFVTDALLLHPDDVLHGRIWQPFTAIWFLPPSGLGHVFLTLIFLWVLGNPSEARLGRRAFLALYVGAGVLSMLALVLLSALAAPVAVAYGPAGALWGLGAFLLLRAPRLPVSLFFLRLPLWAPVVVFLAGGAALRLSRAESPWPLLSYLAAAALGLLTARLSPLGGPRPRRAPPSPPTQSRDDGPRVDALLDKIAADGLDALTDEERAFLEEAARRRSP